MDWKEKICSEVNREYVSKPFPKRCECITVKVRTPVDAPVSGVWMRYKADDLSHRVKMDCHETGKRFRYYCADVEMCYYRLSYRFEFESSEGFIYYTSAGIHTVVPTDDTDFVIIPALRAPSWVPGAVFYQIFPDRFRSGNKEIGVKAGEYQFDGTETRVLSWDQEPPEYDEGRCLDFYNGDLAGIEASVDHFRELSVDALYLNPVFSAKTNHRYDCTDYFHVDEHLGGNEALSHLTETLHAAGIRVMLDISINHTGIEHPWFQMARAEPESREAGFYYRNPDGSFAWWWDVQTLPQLNYGSQELRGLIWGNDDSVLRRYLAPPFSIDGWRFDVAQEVGRRGDDQYCHEIWREVRRSIKEESPETYIIGEHWEDSIDYLQGDQWDGCMNYFASARPIRSWLGELDRFLMGTWGHDPRTARPSDAAELRQAIEQHIRRLPNQLMFLQFNLIDSHDTPRLHHHSAVYQWNLYAGALMLLFTLPGAVSYFYGDEVGLTGHPRSMEGSRYPMEWEKSRWNHDHYRLYRDLGRIRADRRELFARGTFIVLYAEGDLFVCARQYLEEALITVVNRAKDALKIDVEVSQLGAEEAEPVIGLLEAAVNGEFLSLKLQPQESGMILCRCGL